MNATLVLYDSASSKENAETVAAIIGNAKTYIIHDAPQSTAEYTNICGVAKNNTCQEEINNYLSAHKFEISKKNTAQIMPRNKEDAIQAGLHLAAQFRAAQKAMPAEMLLNHIVKFINAHNTCSLATAAGNFVRCTPLEYHFADGKFYILTEGGKKFVGISQNKNVAIAIYEQYTDMHTLASLQASGTIAEIAADDKKYADQLAIHHVTPEAVSSLPVVMHLLEITPAKFELLDSSLAKEGFDAQQAYIFNN